MSAALLKNYQLFLVLRDGMIWPGGYSGPDAYVAYETRPGKRKVDFPAAKSVTWMTEEQGRRSRISSMPAAASIRCTIPATSRCACKNYRDVMGGAYIGHPPLRPFQVHATANRPSHHRGHEALHGQ